MKKFIKLFAYLENNFGDDLMVDILLKKYPEYNFVYFDRWSGSGNFLKYENFYNSDKIYQKYGRLNHFINLITFYQRKDCFFRWLFRKIDKACFCSVYIGGSIYMQDMGESPQKRIKHEYKKLDRPLFVIGANFGPYITNDFRDGFYKYFQKCAGVSFRDYRSYLEFKNIEQVQYAPDVVFNLPKGITRKTGTVIISVINTDKKKSLKGYAENYYSFVASICKEFIAKGKIPVLVAFCEPEGDYVAVQNVIERLDNEKREVVQCVYYQNNMEQIIELFRNADFVLATRFHAMILALRFSKPFFAISYDPKIDNVLNDINCSNYCTMEQLDEISSKDLVNCLDKSIDIEDYEKEAINQFRQLDEFLRGEK